MRRPMISRAAPQGRVTRRPQHTWNVRAKPWQLQPVMIAPVLPGETMRSAIFQSRVVSDPIVNRLMGWWHEYYLYYVPFRSMPNAEHFSNMVLDPEWDPSAVVSNTANPQHNFAGRSSIDWVKECLAAVVKYDFRLPDEEWDQFMIDGLPAISINNQNWTDSLLAESEYEAHDVNLDVDGDGNITASEVEQAMRQYEMLRDMGMVEMDYEDFLRTYGVRGQAVAKREEVTPELLRYVRDWTYPTNTVNPTDGSAASAASWSISERASKDRFFTEPGFLFMLSTTRPKVFMSNLAGSATMMLDNARAWLPAVLTGDASNSLTGFEPGFGPLTDGPTDGDGGKQGYIVDVKDLFLYGDQWLSTGNQVALPKVGTTGDLQRRYAALADIAPLFADPERTSIEQDGVCSLIVAGRQQDTSSTRNQIVVG